MREAIQQYVEREEAREGFRLEVLASWSTYQADGQLNLPEAEQHLMARSRMERGCGAADLG